MSEKLGKHSAKHSSRPSIWVVMSTYNGQDYIREQLDSILAQDVREAADLHIVVRDDGSSDNTVSILEEYAKRGDIILSCGDNLGLVSSFFALISAVPQSADFIATCDQDDRWHTDKLSRALSVLAPKDQSIPLAYCSEYVYCDGDLEPTGYSYLSEHGVHFNTMLYENIACGTTMVFNRMLADMVVAAGREGVYIHDWWIALIAVSLGELILDDFYSIDYRRTGANESASGATGLALLQQRVQKFLAKGQLEEIRMQLAHLYDFFGAEMPADKRVLLQRMSTSGPLGKAFAPVRLRAQLLDELALRALFLTGLL